MGVVGLSMEMAEFAVDGAFSGVRVVKKHLSDLTGAMAGRVWGQSVIVNPSFDAVSQELDKLDDIPNSIGLQFIPDEGNGSPPSEARPPRSKTSSRSIPSLRIDTTPSPTQQRHDPDDFDVLMVAMEIADEIGQLSNAREPVPTDIPLMYVGLDTATAPKLRSWINARFECQLSMDELFAENANAETVAKQILSDSNRLLSTVSCASIPIMFGTTVQSPSYAIPRDVMEEWNVDGVDFFSPCSPLPHGALPNKLSETHCVAVPLPQVNTPAPVPESDPLSIGMASYESWSGRKTGLVVGLLAMGALLKTPASPSFNLPGNVPQDVVSPLTAGLSSPMPGSLSGSATWYSLESAPSPRLSSSIPKNRRKTRQ